MTDAPAADLFRFVWFKPEAGYRWREAVNDSAGTRGHFLTAGVTKDWREYRPFQDLPALFQVFAKLDPTESAVARFASEYGALGVDVPIQLAESKGASPKRARGELLTTWQDEIAYMRHALRILETLERNDGDALGRMISVRDETGRRAGVTIQHGRTVTYRPDRHLPTLMVQTVIAEDLTHRGRASLSVYFPTETTGKYLLALESPERWEAQATVPANTTDGAWAILRRIVNERLRTHTSVALVDAAQVQRLPVALRIEPKNLLGAMWLQLSLAMAGETHRRCETCGLWFAVKPRGRRTDTRFHRPECRAGAHYKKKAEARRLADEGVTVPDIAVRLQTTATHVKRWLKTRTNRSGRARTRRMR